MREVLTGVVKIPDLKVNGKKLPLRVQKGLANMSQYGTNMLACVPGISKKTAESLNLPNIMAMLPADVNNIQVGKKKLGIIGDRIITLFAYKYNPVRS